MSNKATEAILGDLHAMTAESMTAHLKRLKEAGETPSPQFLQAVAKFLKDNGITAAPDAPAITELKFAVPDDDALKEALKEA